MSTDKAMVTDALTRPIIGIENRTAQETFDIMCDRIRRSAALSEAEQQPVALYQLELEDGTIDHSAGIFGTVLEINGVKVVKSTPLYAHPPAQREADEQDSCCPICAVPFKPDDICASDITEGTCHAACLEGSPVVDLDTGEEIPGGRFDTYPYSEIMDPPAKREATEAAAPVQDVAVSDLDIQLSYEAWLDRTIGARAPITAFYAGYRAALLPPGGETATPDSGRTE